MGGLSALHSWWAKDRREQLAACPVTTLVKKCSKCKLPKDRDEFYVNLRLVSGLSSACRACIRELNNKRYYDNKEA
jgi:hypothetical protein